MVVGQVAYDDVDGETAKDCNAENVHADSPAAPPDPDLLFFESHPSRGRVHIVE